MPVAGSHADPPPIRPELLADALLRAIALKRAPEPGAVTRGRRAAAPVAAARVLGEFGLVQLRDPPPDVCRELLELYFAEATGQLHAIGQAADRGAALTVANAAHGLKGSSMIVGAELVATLAGELDARAREGDLRHVGKAVRALRHGLEQTRAALDAAFAPTSAAVARNST